ncbi:hypothetical protein AT1219_40188 [Vibrio alginolyticus]
MLIPISRKYCFSLIDIFRHLFERGQSYQIIAIIPKGLQGTPEHNEMIWIFLNIAFCQRPHIGYDI